MRSIQKKIFYLIFWINFGCSQNLLNENNVKVIKNENTRKGTTAKKEDTTGAVKK